MKFQITYINCVTKLQKISEIVTDVNLINKFTVTETR